MLAQLPGHAHPGAVALQVICERRIKSFEESGLFWFGEDVSRRPIPCSHLVKVPMVIMCELQDGMIKQAYF